MLACIYSFYLMNGEGIKIPGFRYDATIRNYLPISNDTAENRAFNILTAAKIIECDKINSLVNQAKLSDEDIVNYQRKVYPQMSWNNFNTFNVLKHQQIGLGNMRTQSICNINKLKFSPPSNIVFYSDDNVNYYHNLDKCFSPDFDSQIVSLSYSSSPFDIHHSIFKLSFDSTRMYSKSSLIKHYDTLGGIKMSIDEKKIILLSKKEFILVNKDSLTERNIEFTRELPHESQYAFDGGEKLILGVNSKKGITSLDIFDLSSEGRRLALPCHWDRKFVFRDILLDSAENTAYCLIRGRMNNNCECILQHDLRCCMPTQKNLRRLSLNFHQNSAVQMTRVGTYSGLIVTHCHDGRCALWDMRWMDRAAVEYRNVAPGKPNMPISVDRSAQFVTMTDNDNVTRIFNLKTGLILYSEKMSLNERCQSNVFSFYESNGIHSHPTLVSNVTPSNMIVQEVQF